MSKPPVKLIWRALSDGWIAGQRVTKDQEIELTAAEAKYEPVAPVTPEAQTSTKRRGAAETSGS